MNIKGLVLGTAAGALAVTGAQAADLPVAPEPIDYVRVCDAFGPGYYFIPGTDTCLRVAGRIRADYNYFDFSRGFAALDSAFGTSQRSTNAYRFRARAYIYMDSRTNTEFGLLRTFTEVYFTGDYGSGSLFDGGDVAASEGTVGLTLNRAFIQFGGLTFGRTQSFYDFLDAAYASAQFFNANYSDTTTNVAAYTFAFGNGFSASVSLEDEGYRRLQGVDASELGGGVYAGNRFPDIVGNLRVDQGWGSAQIMAAGHNVQTVQTNFFEDPLTDELTGGLGNQSEYGWAVGAGINVNVPFGTGTSVGVQGGYTQGALRYVADTPIGGLPVAPNGIQGAEFVSTAGDFLIEPDGNLELVNAWSVSGGFATSFTPTISFAMQAGYLDVDHGTVGDIDGDGVNDSGDFSNFDIEGFLGYSPVSGFVLGVGAQYKYVDLDDDTYLAGFDAQENPIITEVDDPDALSVFFRAQRTF